MKNKKNLYKKIILLTIIIFSSIIFQGCQNLKYNDQDNIKKDVLIWATFQNDSINPFGLTTYNQATIKPNIYNGLVEFDSVFQIIPSLAESWSNPNNLTWRFNLRKNVTFHNGYNFSSEDVKFSIDNIFLSYSNFIKEVNIIDSFIIDIVTIDPYPGLLQKLAQSFVVFSKKYIEESDSDWPIGTGAYKLIEYVENNYTKFERYDNFWRKKPEIKTVLYKIIKDTNERIDELAFGNVDSIDYNIDENINDIMANENITIVKYPPLSTYIIGFDFREKYTFDNQNIKNPVSDLRVRKAIYHAIDINPLINGPFKGLAQPASQFLTPYIFGYNPDIKRLEYNISKAKQLLNESGYQDGFDIQLDCITEEFDYNLENCNLIAEQLSKIGINVTVNGLSMDEFIQKVVYDKNTSLWLVGWGIISVDGGVVYDLFIKSENNESDGFQNSGHYSNPQVDLLGEKASIEMDPIKRVKLLQDGFRIALVDDVIFVPLFSQELLTLTAKNVIYEPRADLKIILEDISFK